MRQMVFAHGDFDFHAAVGIVAQYFSELGHTGAVGFGVAFDFGHNHLAGLGVLQRIRL